MSSVGVVPSRSMPESPDADGCWYFAYGSNMCRAIFLSAEACDFLDRTEGLDRGFYRRLPVELVTEDGASFPAFAYQGDRRDPRRKPSARYLGLLLTGAREQELPADYVEWLEMIPLAVDEREAG